MDRSARRFLEELLHAPGPSGFEGAVQDVWKGYVGRFAGKVERDVHGSQWATIPGRTERSILLAAHADEVGLIVQYIDDDGYLYVRGIGGIDVSVLPSHRVTVLGRNGHVRGVMGRRPHHLRDKEGEEKVRIEDLPIDIGASNRAEASERVEVGDPAIFGEDFETLGGEFASARNFDNRSGCWVVAEVLRSLAGGKRRPGLTVHGVSSVQEEGGVVGAGMIASRLGPAAAIAIDVTHDTRAPGIRAHKHGDVRCGKGPVLTRGVRTSKPLFEEIRKAADRAGISTQVEIDQGATHTDADPISIRNEGIAVAVLSIPCRYMHTSCEVIHLGDMERTAELLAAFCRDLDPKVDLTLR